MTVDPEPPHDDALAADATRFNRLEGTDKNRLESPDNIVVTP